MDPQTLVLQAWALREAQQAVALAERTVAAIWALWAAISVGGWYAAGATPARQSAMVAGRARDLAGGLGAAYMREILSSSGLTVLAAPAVLPAARNGADLATVYDRPAEAYRRRFSVTEDLDEALRAAEERLQALVDMDLQAARRDGEHQVLTAAAEKPRPGEPVVIGHRRIIHPELSAGGVCGLCVAASDRIYTVADLRELHNLCKCTTAAVTEDYDPGEANDIDLAALYDEAGSTSAADLKRTRWQVNEHGELGPVLTREGDHFQRQGEAPKGDPVERATRELALLEPVLVNLERRAAAGEDVAGPLGYQRDRVALLRNVAA